MKRIIAVIGDANIEKDKKKQSISIEIGKLIIDNGYLLATGGFGGVMEFASKGAKSSESYTENSIIGVLPDYHPDNANPFIDIPITTGLGLGRNLLLVSMSNAVIVVGGGSGTLNEISAAWQMNKLIIAIDVEGWSKNLGGKALDKRRYDIVYSAKNAQDAIEILNQKLEYYQARRFSGVKLPRINEEKASEIIREYYNLDNDITYLGKGSEGYVFTDFQKTYKIIDNNESSLELYWTLLSLSETLKSNDTEYIPTFEIALYDHKYLLINYPYEQTEELKPEELIPMLKFINLMKEFDKIKWSLTDFKPQNLRVKRNGDLLVIDIGKSFIPSSDYLFKSMCRRAFVTYKLEGKINDLQDFKKFLTPVNEVEDFKHIVEFGFSEENLKNEYHEFYRLIKAQGKKDVLNPIIVDVFKKLDKVKTVLDYGSGYGDISKSLKDIGLSVTAYEPDGDIIDKYKERYYGDISLIDSNDIENHIQSGKKCDSVLCSLVLCHPVAESENERIKIVKKIMKDIYSLSNKYVIIAICNPLYTNQKCSSIQKRIIENFNYNNIVEFKKEIYSSNNIRTDIHRPLSFYETLFSEFKLNLTQVIQSNDIINDSGIINSDFMVFILTK